FPQISNDKIDGNFRGRMAAVKRRIILLASIFIGCGAATAPPAQAWASKGHQIIALIAEDRLEPATTRKLHEIIGKDIPLSRISTCADVEKFAALNCGDAFGVGMDSSTYRWHFIDLPLTIQPTDESIATFCRPGGVPDNCVVGQIRRDLAVLKNP